MTPTIGESPVATSEPSTDLDPFRSTSAVRSLPAAWAAAREWRTDALWYGVVPYTSVERALALPLDDSRPAWFFRFGAPDGNAELIVEVLDGRVVGVNETVLPAYIEPPINELRPIKSGEILLDSTAVMETYLRQHRGLLSPDPALFLDYRLATPIGEAHPIWTLYDAQNIAAPVLVIDAATGEVIDSE